MTNCGARSLGALLQRRQDLTDAEDQLRPAVHAEAAVGDLETGRRREDSVLRNVHLTDVASFGN